MQSGHLLSLVRVVQSGWALIKFGESFAEWVGTFKFGESCAEWVGTY